MRNFLKIPRAAFALAVALPALVASHDFARADDAKDARNLAVVNQVAREQLTKMTSQERKGYGAVAAYLMIYEKQCGTLEYGDWGLAVGMTVAVGQSFDDYREGSDMATDVFANMARENGMRSACLTIHSQLIEFGAAK